MGNLAKGTGNGYTYISYGDGTTGIMISDTGSVGINTATPKKNLEVNGTMNATTVCGNRYHSLVTSANALSDTGNEVATGMTALETEGKVYTCIDCITGAGIAADCTTIAAAATLLCEFRVNC